MLQQSVKVIVEGRVQGVGYRYFVLRAAERLHLHGHVRNLPDGRVETIAEGDRASLLELIESLRQGPNHARVSQISVDWLDAGGTFSDFQIRQ